MAFSILSARFIFISALSLLSVAHAESNVTLTITNNCSDAIFPGLYTQGGRQPDTNGFELAAKESRDLIVTTEWNGRLWGRTNCTFDGDGKGSCMTGDCGGLLNCEGIVRMLLLPFCCNTNDRKGTASTLAEFNLPGYENQSFYDISLVDGYNLPLAIIAVPLNASAVSPNTTNPACVGSVNNVAAKSFNPYTNDQQSFLGTTESHPLPFESSQSPHDIATWCPYDLQQNPLDTSQADRPCPCLTGSDVKHPAFNPCLSACSKYGKSEFCCTGKHDTSAKCQPNYYSQRAKIVCPDAYSYAYDDEKSTFAVQTGSSFEVVFCPGGRSTRILQTLREQGNVYTSLAVVSMPDMLSVAGALNVIAVVMALFG